MAGARMSVSNIASSFSSTAFFKAVREKVPYGCILPSALLSGIGIGMSLWAIDEIRQINEQNPSNSVIKSEVAAKVSIVRNTWYATAALTCAGLAVPHLGFVIATITSLGLSFAVLVSIKEKLSFAIGTSFSTVELQQKFEVVPRRAFQYLIPAATLITWTVVIAASHGALGQKN